MTITIAQLDHFCAEVVLIRQEYADRMGYTTGPTGNVELHVTAEAGKKYARIVIRRNPTDQHGSVYAFVSLDNGDIYKPAGWKGPAKHVRGNIVNPRACCGPHGVAYLRLGASLSRGLALAVDLCHNFT